MRNWKIRRKFIFLLALYLLGTVLTLCFSLYNENAVNQKNIAFTEQSIRENYDEHIKMQVDAAIRQIDSLYQQHLSGKMTLSEAKTEAAALLRSLHYGDEGYFWADTVDGTNVVLYGSAVEGTNRYDFKDAKGKQILQENIQTALAGGGYTDYYFPKEGDTAPLPKRAYSAYYEPFGWVIGTGNYTDDIDAIITEKQQVLHASMLHHLWVNLITFLILFSGMIFLSAILTNSLTGPLAFAVNQAQRIASGKLNWPIPDHYLQRKDEVGTLSRALLTMQTSLADLISEKEAHNNRLRKEKDFLHIMMVSIGEGVIATDTKGIITLCNPVAQEILGLPDDALIGKNLSTVLQLSDMNTETDVESTIYEVLRTGKKSMIREVLLKLPYQSDFLTIEEDSSPLKDMNGNNVGAVLIFRDISEKKTRQKEIEYLNYHDQLTNLYNRRFFEMEYQRLDGENLYPLGIIVADLNGLKLTNDVFGHLAGDSLIQTFANILKSQLRSQDVIARIGGDEFSILLPQTGMYETAQLVSRLKAATEKERAGDIPISAAFGYEVKTSSHDPFMEVFKQADAKMYDEKITENQKVKENLISCIVLKMFELDPEKEEYYEKIKLISRMLGQKLGLSNTKDLETASLMHDLGNVTLDQTLFQKTDKFKDTEWCEMRRHPVAGYHILRTVSKYTKVAEIVLSHHENYDGTGYPRGLSGNSILIEARILSVVTAFCAMTSDRPYRKKYTHQQALAEIAQCAGTKYDPHIVDAFAVLCKEQPLLLFTEADATA